MSTRKRKASSSEEPVCVLCGRADVDPNICGHTLDEKGIRVHQYCLEFAITFTEASLIRLATEGLPLGAIRRAAKHATKQQCFVCGERGAAITCSETGCERSFHLPCAMDGECVTQHFRQRRCYCWEHRPRQEIQEAPEEGTICLICLEPVGDSLSYHTMACPTCQHAWFHRGCIQQQALNAGAFCFYCPGCRDKDQFFQEMATMGIQIPHRRPNWIDEHTYAFLLERHSRCDASECLYHGGREQAERRGPWQLILCSSCAAEGTHRRCSHLSNTRATWECNSCAGLGTGKRQSAMWHHAGARHGLAATARGGFARVCLPQEIPLRCCSFIFMPFLPLPAASSANTEIAGPSTASQRALEPASGSMEPQNISSMPASQAALGTSQSSQLPEHSELPSVPETEQGTNGQHSSEDRAEGIRVLQGISGSRAQKTAQAARKKPLTKPLPAATSGPEFSEPAKKTPRQQAKASRRGAERHPQINKICNIEIPDGFQSAPTQGTVQARRAGPQPKSSSRETSGKQFLQLTPKRQQEPGPTAEAIPGMKLLPGTTSETKSPQTAPESA
ncbi:PHD finger protein 7-like [Gallus gallus]|uniref:PHD finger protein 7-like n=1 Tax=Gallus gallus TaxID=9031 RepID=UPI001AEAAA1B|nr:PHD finger protein 7-like [Gallus gallus]